MRRIYGVLLALMLLIVGGAALGQTAETSAFELVQEIGQVRPRGIIYDPHFDRMALVDPLGRLLLVDARTFETQHVLYESGFYNAYKFSHDGRYLALAIDLRVEVWDTQTGTLAADFEPDGALRVEGPLYFSPDDGLLSFNTQVRAPQELRRSENDTTNLPWIWDVAADRRERASILANRVTAVAFFDYRNGFVYGENDTVLAGLPQRLMVLTVDSAGTTIMNEIPAPNRYEQDPIAAWFSLDDDMMYTIPTGENALWQIDTRDQSVLQLPIGRDLTRGQFERYASIVLSDQSRIIGRPNDTIGNDFLRLLFGAEYSARFGYRPLTVTLIDILTPATPEASSTGLLLYIFDETRAVGRLDFLRPLDGDQIALHPDGNKLAVRRTSGEGRVEIYNLDTGVIENSFAPALFDLDGTHLLAYNATGDVLISDFQRFDPVTGEVLFENLNLNYGFEQFFFTQDSRQLLTQNGSNWWVWDILSGEVVQREIINTRGSVLDVSPDNQRYLSLIETQQGRGVEIYDVRTQERRSVFFEPIQDRFIEQVIPSPDWEHFFVIYGVVQYGPYAPGNEIAIYGMDEGKMWFVAGDDLPFPDGRQYGWLGNDRVYIYSENYGSRQPDRVYGVAYDPNGLPACLVDVFPQDYDRWLGLWERLNSQLPSDELARLALNLCALLPATIEEVESVFFPTATPTRPPVTATPSVIAGVPVCLTDRFPNEARQYAAEWRAITEGLLPEQVAELEELLCTGLTGAESPPRSLANITSNVRVMTIDIYSGAREIGTYLPPIPNGNPYQFPPNIQPVLNQFQREFNYTPNGALSPDAQYFAIFTDFNHIRVYRLRIPYQTLVDNERATEQAIAEEQQQGGFATEAPARVVRLRPTERPPFEPLGQPRPTLTPTVTPTAPPRTDEDVNQPALGEVEEICPFNQLFDISSPPPDYAPAGRLFVTRLNSSVTWVLEPETGELYLDETLPRCGISTNCAFSFDLNWIITSERDLVLSRPDGSDAVILGRAGEENYWPRDLAWFGLDTLQYSVSRFAPERSLNEVTFVERLNPLTGEISEPTFYRGGISVNGLQTETLSIQPGLEQRFAVVRTAFNTGRGIGYKLYIYNRATDEALYFARFADEASDMQFEWHPLGYALYYRYPNDPDWYLFDPATREHYVLGALPGGSWSRDGRYRVSGFSLPFDAIEERIAAGEPIPNLSIWDSQSGLTRRYCLPGEVGRAFNEAIYWSPDNRYLAFRMVLPHERSGEVVRQRTFILDTETGSVTELTFDIDSIVVWTIDAQ